MGALNPTGCQCCVIGGDVDHSGIVNVGDLTYLVAYVFIDGPPPPCTEEGNVDGQSGECPIDIADVTFLVSYLLWEVRHRPRVRKRTLSQDQRSSYE